MKNVWLIFIAVVVCVFFLGLCNQWIMPIKKIDKPDITPPSQMVDTVIKYEVVYKKLDDSLMSVINRRDAELATLKPELKTAKGEVARLYEAFDNKYGNVNNDYEDGKGAELREWKRLLKEATGKADSLCQTGMALQDSTIAAQRAQISARDSLYVVLRGVFDKGIAQQNTLINYSKQLERQVSKRKIQSVVWKVVAAGAITAYLIK